MVIDGTWYVSVAHFSQRGQDQHSTQKAHIVDGAMGVLMFVFAGLLVSVHYEREISQSSDEVIAGSIVGMVWQVRAQQEELRKNGRDVPIRVITAAAIFDGHDAAIGIFRRIFQSMGCEVIHLGHDRSAEDVAKAAIQEDAHLIAITSYQGGAVEMFTHTKNLLDAAGFGHVVLVGGVAALYSHLR